MARNLRILTVIISLIAIVAIFVGCQTVELIAPTPYLDGHFLCWDEIEGASGYEILVDEKYTLTTVGTVYPLEFNDTQIHFIKVRATREDGILGPYSQTISYTASKEVEKKSLSAPIITDINGNGVMSWQCSDNIFTVGYNVYIDNVFSAYVTNDGQMGTAPLQYALPILENGSHNIQVQAKSGKADYSDSLRSDVMIYLIDEGKVVLSKLAKPTIEFDPTDFTISWQAIRYSGGYSVLIDGAEYSYKPENNSGKIQFSLAPYGSGIQSVAVSAISSDPSLYSNSNYSYSIKFPFVTDYPLGGLKLSYEKDNYFLTWDSNVYCEGYELVIDGLSQILPENRYDLSKVSDGVHVFKVRSIAIGGFFTNSYFSEELSIDVKGGKPVLGRLSIPQNVILASVYTEVQIDDNEEITYDYIAEHHITWEKSANAQSYILTIVDANNPISITTKTTTDNYYVLPADIGEEYYLSIRAQANGYQDSGESEMVFCGFEKDESIHAPTSVFWTENGFSWDGELKNNQVFEYVYNGNVFKTKSNLLAIDEFTEGTHVFKVRILSEEEKVFNSPFTEEYIVDLPIKLQTPQIQLKNGEVYWEAIKNASGYRIYCGNDVLVDSSTENRIALSPLFDVDGEYMISVQALGDFPYIDSLRSAEVKFEKDDSPEGSEGKPIEINTVADFLAMVENPDYVYSIKASTLDFNFSEIQPLFDVDNPFCGVLKGNGCTLKNVVVKADDFNSLGLFGAVCYGQISDLTIENITVLANESAFDYVGALVGYSEGVTFKNISITGNVNGASMYAGGVFGYLSGNVSNISFLGKINANASYLGGIVGLLNGDGENLNCEIDTKLENSGNYTGGVIGILLNGNISKVSFKGEISATGKNVGGICGFSHGEKNTISQCYAIANIRTDGEQSYFVGGINGGMLGQLDMSKCFFEGKIESGISNNKIGGISALATKIEISSFTGEITAGGRVGGISADCPSIIKSHVGATITGIGNLCEIGGFVSKGESLVDCSFEGKILMASESDGDVSLIAHKLNSANTLFINCSQFDGTSICSLDTVECRYVYTTQTFDKCINVVLPLENLPEGFGAAWSFEEGAPQLILGDNEEIL